MHEPRYAVYWAPEARSDLSDTLNAIVGYDALNAADIALTPPPGFSRDDWHALTTEPRRYGIHATLKAPFRLRHGATELSLAEAIAAIARATTPFSLGHLQLQCLGRTPASRFVALTGKAHFALTRLERRLVIDLDPFRAPLNAAELARRNPAQLTPRQRIFLETYGYPFVLDEFRFHVTLSNATPECERVHTALACLLQHHKALKAEVLFSSIALFRQDGPNEPFHCIERVPLSAPVPLQLGA